MTRACTVLGVFALGLATALPLPAAQVTVYRCTDAAGRVSLRDSPCRSGERQQARSMLKPVDAPPERRVATAPRPRATPVLPATRVVVLAAPRPLFECTTPDGERYESESPEGNPRFVPLWTLGVPVIAQVGPRAPGIPRPPPRGPRPGTRYPPGAGYPPVAYVPAGTWVRDTCHALPAAETCARLQDRRDALDRRWFSALQGDRDAISREQRGIDARLASECGG